MDFSYLIFDLPPRAARRLPRLPLLAAVLPLGVVATLVPLALVKLHAVHRLDVLSQRGRVRVPLGAAGGATGVGLLRESDRKKGERV